MAQLLKTYLLVTGIGTLICIFLPGLVQVLLWFIVPGLILSVMPTALLWGAVFAAVWFPLQGIIGSFAATVVATAATAALLFTIPLPSQSASEALLQRAAHPEVIPDAPVRIAGHVRIDVQGYLEIEAYDRNNPGAVRPIRCTGLCAAALFTPGVESVTLNNSEWNTAIGPTAIGDAPLAASARTFRRVPKAQCKQSLLPSSAAGLGDQIDDVRALEAYWNVRLSTADCIIAVPTRTEHDMFIAIGRHSLFESDSPRNGWSLGADPVDVERLEVYAAGGAALLRKLKAKTEVLRRPLWINPTGWERSFRFGWARSARYKGTYEQQKQASILKAHTNLVLFVDPTETARLARDQLKSMVADPSVTSSDPGWASAELYFAQLRKRPIDDVDRDLLPALIRDRRMRRFQGIWDVLKALGDEQPILRSAAVDRLTLPGPEDDNSDYSAGKRMNMVIERQPPGTFASLTPAELALLNDLEGRRRAPALVMRLADSGAPAVPMLLDTLQPHLDALKAAQKSDKRDFEVIDAARVAFCRLGPAASAALPTLVQLYDQGGLGSYNESWRFVLARLGHPVENFIKPDNMGGTNEQYQARMRREVADFKDEYCRSNFG
jgi:hypothetical protein